MREPRYTPEERARILKQVEEKHLADEERDLLINKAYRKSFLFIAAWVVRLLYIILFILVLFFNDKSGGLEEEKVINKNVEKYEYVGRRISRQIKDYHIQTNVREYVIDISDNGIPEINIGDTILIDRNIFGRPIYITKSNWDLEYGMGNLNPIPYTTVLMLTLFSLLLNDGTIRFAKRILLLVIVVDIIAIITYFLT